MEHDPMMANPELLLRGFQSGNNRAFEYIYHLHYAPLFAFACRLLKDDFHAGDIVADSFIKLWKRHQQFNHLPGIPAFLYTVTRNACFSSLRQQHRKVVSIDDRYSLPDATSVLVETELVRAELLQLALYKGSKLPPQMRKIFELFYLEGLKLEEIAQLMNLSIHTVRVQRSRALQRIRELFMEKGWLKTVRGLMMMLVQ